ncbi:ARM repeat-containing protein [Martensiomyces pterosporus]|nr:ARM repeat-containing protein [Martensiomyces pterosporus]
MDDSLIKRRERQQELQRANRDSWCGRAPRIDAKGLDANLKKNTGFIKKCKASMGQDSAAQLLREVKLLKLEKYVSEIVPAAAEGLLKCKASADVSAAIDVMSSLHSRFPLLFTAPLISQILKSLAPPNLTALAAMSPEQREKEEQARLARQKTLLRISGEMYFGKLMAKVREMVQQPGHCVFVGVLQNLFLSDKEHHLSIQLATAVAKAFKEDFALTDDSPLEHAACSHTGAQLQGDADEHMVTAESCRRIKAILCDYCDTAISHLTDMHKTLVRLRRNNEEKLFNKGIVHADVKEKIERHTKSFERLSESVNMLCEALAREPPHLEDSADGENKLGINFDGPVAPVGKDSMPGPWEDEEERAFYEAVLDLQSRLPPSLLTSHRKKAKDSSAGAPASSTAAAGATEGKVGDENSAGSSALTIVQQTGSTKEVTQTVAPLKFSDILRRLPAFASKDGIDETAVDFCYVNNKANRAKLIQSLVDVPRRQLYIIPFYARFIATLHPYFPEIGNGVIEELNHEFRWLTKKRFKDLLETRLKNIKYISELTKFRVAPLHVPFHCAKALLEQFHVQNLEVLCSLLEDCGRFLLAQPETSARVSTLLDILMRKRQVLNLDDRTNQLIENACRTCRPSALGGGQVAKYRTPYEQYIRKLVYEDLSRHTAEKVCLKLRKLPWNDGSPDDTQRVKRTLVSCFSKIWKVKHSHVYLVTMIANALGRLHPWFRVAVADTVFENIRLGLERNLFAHNQRRVSEVRYVGEMFVYKFVDSKEVLDLLYLLTRFGHSEPHPFPGRDCELDSSADYFRTRLVCTLLSTCGRFISSADDRMVLEEYSIYFQMYFLAKQQPIPIDIDYSIDQMYETVFPKVRRYATWGEAAQAMSDLMHARAQETCSQQAGGSTSVVDTTDDQAAGRARAGSILSMSLDLSKGNAGDERLEGGGLGSSNASSGDADDKLDATTTSGSDGENDSANDEEGDEDAVHQRSREDEEAEMEEARRQMEAMKALLEEEEEDRLEREFNKLMAESIDSRKNERSGKLDVGIPMHLLGKSSAAQSSEMRTSSDAAAPADRSTDNGETTGSNAIKFSLLTGKKQRPVVREVDIPVESQIAKNLRQQEEATLREKAHLKKIVLDYERREADEQRQLYEKELAVRRARAGYASASARTESAYRSPVPRVVPGSTFVGRPQPTASRRRKSAAAHDAQSQQPRTTLKTRIPDHFL